MFLNKKELAILDWKKQPYWMNNFSAYYICGKNNKPGLSPRRPYDSETHRTELILMFE